MEMKVRDRAALLSDLSRALENSQLELVYQPLFSTSLRQTAGFEALLRWRHPVRGMIPPSEFIPLAEEGGLIQSIGDWALRTACDQALHWPADFSVSVNLSTRQLADPHLVEKVAAVLRETELEPRRLEFEVTESALLHKANLSVLREIADLGVRVALDDFGTGYSSLSYLQLFQFSKLKIDQSFIVHVPHDKKSLAIVETVVSLARTLGMQVTAEGIENAVQFEWAAQHCDQIQGYYIAKPMFASAVGAYLAMELPLPRRTISGRSA